MKPLVFRFCLFDLDAVKNFAFRRIFDGKHICGLDVADEKAGSESVSDFPQLDLVVLK